MFLFPLNSGKMNLHRGPQGKKTMTILVTVLVIAGFGCLVGDFIFPTFDSTFPNDFGWSFFRPPIKDTTRNLRFEHLWTFTYHHDLVRESGKDTSISLFSVSICYISHPWKDLANRDGPYWIQYGTGTSVPFCRGQNVQNGDKARLGPPGGLWGLQETRVSFPFFSFAPKNPVFIWVRFSTNRSCMLDFFKKYFPCLLLCDSWTGKHGNAQCGINVDRCWVIVSRCNGWDLQG